MKEIISRIRTWFTAHRESDSERRLRELQDEAARVINIRELTEAPHHYREKYGVFLQGNLIAVYDEPSKELLDHLLRMRKMYVEFWGPVDKYVVK
jgi:hypothetical protein